jgi:glucuronosyltransferase
LKEGKQFDIVVVSVFGSETGYYLAKKFGDASIVLYSTGQVSFPWMDLAMGQPHNPSYMPLILFEYGTDMSFLQRVKNLLVTTFMHTMRDYFLLNKVETLLDKHFPGEVRPSLRDIEKNASAALAFSHPLFLDGWRPTSPNYVHLGMMNCR